MSVLYDIVIYYRVRWAYNTAISVVHYTADIGRSPVVTLSRVKYWVQTVKPSETVCKYTPHSQRQGRESFVWTLRLCALALHLAGLNSSARNKLAGRSRWHLSPRFILASLLFIRFFLFFFFFFSSLLLYSFQLSFLSALRIFHPVSCVCLHVCDKKTASLQLSTFQALCAASELWSVRRIPEDYLYTWQLSVVIKVQYR